MAKASFEAASVLEAAVMFVFTPLMLTPLVFTRFAEAVIIAIVATRATPISGIEVSIIEPRDYPVRPLFRQDWVVYAKPPFGWPEHVLQYLARYTHRVAMSPTIGC